jgi:ubiquinone/menaquinone biosynthesis C-methylase UbiE
MTNKYLDMQRSIYDQDASNWSTTNKNPVVGTYDQHNSFSDYDNFLFKDFDTSGLVALEYGCGPGRNIVKFSNRFSRIDGTDISPICIEKAKVNMEANGLPIPNLFVTPGDSIPAQDSTYDVVFAVICLQHICVHDIRYKIMSDMFRVLKSGGKLCFQMGIGDKPNAINYYENDYDALLTNGGRDVSIENEQFLINDLTKIGFKNYKSDIRPVGPGDCHANWIWVQVEK